jgi:hypothetical protein
VPGLEALEKRAARLRDFERRLAAKGLGSTCAAAHARLAADSVAAAGQRRRLVAEGSIKPLAAASEAAANRVYAESAAKLCDGLELVLKGYEKAGNPEQRKIHEAWLKTSP